MLRRPLRSACAPWELVTPRRLPPSSALSAQGLAGALQGVCAPLVASGGQIWAVRCLDTVRTPEGPTVILRGLGGVHPWQRHGQVPRRPVEWKRRYDPHVPLMADRADRSRLVRSRRRLVRTASVAPRRHDGRRLVQECPALGQLRLPDAVSQEAKVPNPLEPARQDMQDKASQKLHRVQGHGAELMAVFRVFPAEGHLAVFQGDEPLVGDSNTMRVARQILQDMLRGRQRLFGIDHPLSRVERGQKLVPALRRGQRLASARQGEGPLGGLAA
jgi:hypothetical protein